MTKAFSQIVKENSEMFNLFGGCTGSFMDVLWLVSHLYSLFLLFLPIFPSAGFLEIDLTHMQNMPIDKFDRGGLCFYYCYGMCVAQ